MAEQVLIQLRVSPEEAEELRRSAELAGRSLPREMQHRLDAYRPGTEGGASRALGDLVTIIADRAGRHLPRTDNPQRDRAALLGVVKNAITLVLDRLGADVGHDTGDFPVSKGVSWDIHTHLTAGENMVTDTPERHALRRIGRALSPAPQKVPAKRRGK